MRRMQANLAYLANVAERGNRPNIQNMAWPPIMAAPSSPATLVEMYTKLQGLFPDWKGQSMKAVTSPRQNSMGGGGHQGGGDGV
jgi:hypothetical protein